MARDTVRIDGLDDLLRRLKALGAEAQKSGGPVGQAVRAGGKVIASQAKANVEQIVATPNIGGGDESTGLLASSIRTMRAKAHKVLKGETYIVTVPKARRYPIGARSPSGAPVALVGRLLEYGTPKRRPMAWMRPAFHGKKNEAVKVMTTTLLKGIARLERKLARKSAPR